MITLSQLTELLGWVLVINLTYFLFATIVVAFMSGAISTIHAKFFRLEAKELDSKYFDFLSIYKVMMLVFIVAPYIALKIMGQ